MLTLYIKGMDDIPPDLEIITDIEREFSLFGKLKDCPDVVKVLKNIEQAEYCNEFSFIDRFGYKLRAKHLSTGCKAAVLAICYPEKLIDLRECGRDARDAILTYVKNGNVMIHPESLNLDIGSDDDDEVVCVKYKGKVFNDLYKLNEYIFEEC